MSRSISDTPAPEPEKSSLEDVHDTVYALGLYLEVIERKVDALLRLQGEDPQKYLRPEDV
jgi:hypothetical protein